MIQHISFDLWLTLIKSNPLFKRKRAEMIADSFRPKNMNVEQIEALVQQKDRVFDRYNEMTGVKIPARFMYLSVLKAIDPQSRNADIESVLWLMLQSNELLMDYPPQLLNDKIPDILKALQSETGSLNIGSNTGYMEGSILRRVLKKMGIYDFFTFFVFSDEIQASKPSPAFFQSILDRTSFPKSGILHIGDNLKTDYRGAVKFGFKAILLTDSNYTLHDIKSKL
ncbi:MAG: HAD family hydrolase [Prevotellaceae bacterium]|jgi:putative hydrolase of the HAD superfamily|nr:HAD family hydrolase [Prevotellaceae bacterium]